MEINIRNAFEISVKASWALFYTTFELFYEKVQCSALFVVGHLLNKPQLTLPLVTTLSIIILTLLSFSIFVLLGVFSSISVIVLLEGLAVLLILLFASSVAIIVILLAVTCIVTK